MNVQRPSTNASDEQRRNKARSTRALVRHCCQQCWSPRSLRASAERRPRRAPRAPRASAAAGSAAVTVGISILSERRTNSDALGKPLGLSSKKLVHSTASDKAKTTSHLAACSVHSAVYRHMKVHFGILCGGTHTYKAADKSVRRVAAGTDTCSRYTRVSVHGGQSMVQ